MAESYSSGLDDLQNQMSRFLEHLQGKPRISAGFATEIWTPNINVYESSTHYMVLAELPGIEPKKIQASILGKTLMLEGERNIEPVHEMQRCTHLEILSGPFRRQIQLNLAAMRTILKLTIKTECWESEYQSWSNRTVPEKSK